RREVSMLVYYWSDCRSRARERRRHHFVRVVAVVVAITTSSQIAAAHGIVGNRLFPGTLSFDDPAVADELAFPTFSRLKRPDDGSDVTDSRFAWSFSRLLTPVVSAEIGSGWIHRNWETARTSGFDATNVGLKALLYKSEAHEVMVSAGLAWGIGGSGAGGV